MLVDEPFLVVGDYKGNPGSFNFFSNGKSVLSIRANVSLNKEIGPGAVPVIEGDTPVAFALSKATGFKMGVGFERVIRVNGRIEFIDKGVSYIILEVIEVNHPHLKVWACSVRSMGNRLTRRH